MHQRWLWVALLGAPALVAAQTPLIEPSVALSCLAPAHDQRGAPEYPFEAWKQRRHGLVQVELTFDAPDKRPQVRVLRQLGDDSFVEAVQAHVRNFRMPCIGKGADQARLRFDYEFTPDDRKVATAEPRDLDHEVTGEQMSCIRHISGKGAPAYPPQAIRREEQGRVHLVLRFDAADRPPVTTVLSAHQRGALHGELEVWAQGLRMPCFQGTRPAAARLTYVYTLKGSKGYGFKDIGLMQFLGAIRGIREQRVDFDFNQMGCPFDVRVTYLQPHAANEVSQLVTYDPVRLPFIEWLRKAELNVSHEMLEAVYADQLTLTIPCTRLNLIPKGVAL